MSTTSNPPNDAPVIIVGGGLAGLGCARHLHRHQVPFLLCEASPEVGGRVATDVIDGFRLDRGFQVLLTAYPEAAQVFDYQRLNMCPFYPGALIQVGDRRYRFADPWRKPLSSIKGLLAPVASPVDAWHIARLRRDAVARWQHPPAVAASTLDHLTQYGLSPRVIDRFFRPFFGGVFLDRTLSVPSWFFRFVFAMFAKGPAALPKDGMHQLPMQLAAELPTDRVRTKTPVVGVEPHSVQLASGEALEARAVVVATDADAVSRLVRDRTPTTWNSTTTLYYAAAQSPLRENILLLNGNKTGRVNHVCVPSDVSPVYAPPGEALVSVSLIGEHELDDPDLNREVLEELDDWFGPQVEQWRLLKIYRIARALPSCPPVGSRGIECVNGVVLCGDHTHDPSINGALVSGRLAAQSILTNSRQD